MLAYITQQAARARVPSLKAVRSSSRHSLHSRMFDRSTLRVTNRRRPKGARRGRRPHEQMICRGHWC